MLVVHGLWVYGACYLWAEDSALPAAAPAWPGRPSRAPRPHPFALRASGLARVLARLPEPAAGLAGQAVEDELTLRLPSGTDGPLASPELMRPSGQDGAGASLAGRAPGIAGTLAGPRAGFRARPRRRPAQRARRARRALG